VTLTGASPEKKRNERERVREEREISGEMEKEEWGFKGRGERAVPGDAWHASYAVRVAYA